MLLQVSLAKMRSLGRPSLDPTVSGGMEPMLPIRVAKTSSQLALTLT